MPEKNRVSSVATNTTWFSFTHSDASAINVNDVTDDGQGLRKYQDAIMHNLNKKKITWCYSAQIKKLVRKSGNLENSGQQSHRVGRWIKSL